MKDLLSGNLSYWVSKLFEGIYNDYPLVRENLDNIGNNVNVVKEELGRKYGSLSESPQGFIDVIKRLDYIIKRIEVWVDSENLFENDDAEIFVDGLSERLKELKEMLVEIDD